MNEILRKQIELLPDKPGCYLMHNANDEIIYVGKAKNLKKRVSQYFLRQHEGKTAAMVMHVDHFEIIITKTEKEALILEMNLIQKHHPRYNIMLMDDKHYPYIALHKNVKNPYVSLSRNVKDKKCEYFGPYPNSGAAYEVIELINKLFPLRKCKNVPNKPCLYYHLGTCLAPCISIIDENKYKEIVDNIKAFLNGKNTEVIKEIKDKIKHYSENLDFENALVYKKMLDSIEHINEKQTVEFRDKTDKDVFAFHVRDNYVSIVVFNIRNGMLLSKRAFFYELLGEINDFVSEMIYQYYSINKIPNEIYVSNEEIKDDLNSFLEANVFFPSKGKMHDLIQTVEANAKESLDEHFLTARIDDDLISILDRLGNILKISTPTYIELFDNSHLQGTNAIGAMVAFINGVPYKKLYRKFNIQGVNKKDDLASMEETLRRRYARLQELNSEMPNLIIVDGGSEQIEVAKKIKEELNLPFAIAGLVKTDKHRTSALIDEKLEIHNLVDDKKLFFLLTRMQDEVHRYAITTHIKKRNKSIFNSVFDGIKGLGTKRKELLIKTFPSIKELKNAKIEELEQILPKETAEELYNKLKDNKDGF